MQKPSFLPPSALHAFYPVPRKCFTLLAHLCPFSPIRSHHPFFPLSLLDKTHPGGPNPASKLDSEHPDMISVKLYYSRRGESRKPSCRKTLKVGWGFCMAYPQGKRSPNEKKSGAGREGEHRPWSWLRRTQGQEGELGETEREGVPECAGPGGPGTGD